MLGGFGSRTAASRWRPIFSREKINHVTQKHSPWNRERLPAFFLPSKPRRKETTRSPNILMLGITEHQVSPLENTALDRPCQRSGLFEMVILCPRTWNREWPTKQIVACFLRNECARTAVFENQRPSMRDGRSRLRSVRSPMLDDLPV